MTAKYVPTEDEVRFAWSKVDGDPSAITRFLAARDAKVLREFGRSIYSYRPEASCVTPDEVWALVANAIRAAELRERA